jgi:uncharacterized membrane protein YqgA involved in biofilm formation
VRKVVVKKEFGGDYLVLLGSFVNGLAIIVGSLLGSVLRNISEQTKDTVTKAIGIGVMVLGVQMALKTSSFTLIIVSLCLGALIGEGLKIEDGMNRLGMWLQVHFAKSGSNFADGFVTASLVFVIGSMGIIGAIQSGVSGNHSTLFTKAVMDGFLAIMLTASLGIGVLFAAIPVFLYQGLIAIFASLLVSHVPPELLKQIMSGISEIGGLLILAIGLNIAKLTKIRVSNLLPSIVLFVAIICVRYYWF